MYQYSEIRQVLSFSKEIACKIKNLAIECEVYQPSNDDFLLYATDANYLVGFIIWREILPEIELLSIAVKAEYRGQKIGQELLKIADRHWKKNADKVFLELRESNLIARNLYTKFDFQEIARRKNYYPAKQGKEAAIIMCREYHKHEEKRIYKG